LRRLYLALPACQERIPQEFPHAVAGWGLSRDRTTNRPAQRTVARAEPSRAEPSRAPNRRAPNRPARRTVARAEPSRAVATRSIARAHFLATSPTFSTKAVSLWTDPSRAGSRWIWSVRFTRVGFPTSSEIP